MGCRQTTVFIISEICICGCICFSFYTKSPGTTSHKASAGNGTAKPLQVDKCSGHEASVLQCARAEVTGDREVGVQCYQPADLTGRCGRDELPFGDNCYLIGQQRVTRLKAEIRCQQAGARLVEVTSQVSGSSGSETG